MNYEDAKKLLTCTCYADTREVFPRHGDPWSDDDVREVGDWWRDRRLDDERTLSKLATQLGRRSTACLQILMDKHSIDVPLKRWDAA